MATLAMDNVRNVLAVTPVTYDEVEASSNLLGGTGHPTYSELTHPQETAVVSGGTNGLPKTLPETARGEYIYFKGEITNCEGEIELEGFELYYSELDYE